MSENKNYSQALSTLVTVFFFWGFIAASNGVFIPFCKTYFQIDQFQSQLVDFAFYGAYYFGALMLFIFSTTKSVMSNLGFISSTASRRSTISIFCSAIISFIACWNLGSMDSTT